MLFTTIKFLLFTAALVAIYYIIPKKARWAALLCASLVFYWSIGRATVLCVVAGSLAAWATALGLARLQEHENRERSLLGPADKDARKEISRRFASKSKLLASVFIVVMAASLVIFKFYGLAVKTFEGFPFPSFNIIAPLGVSFYTLQLISYVVDVKNKRVEAEKSPFKVLLFTSYFPQVIQGPISRFSDLAPELFEPKPFSYEGFVSGLQRMLWGYFKKLVVADRLAVLVSQVYGDSASHTGWVVVLATVFYTVELYADFSGGIDIALGVSELFGIKLAENFNMPFFSKDISEFWRRWHITLGTFLRDYIFYPLTLSKRMLSLGRSLTKKAGKWAGKWIPAYIAMFVMWFISGVWHGEGLHYIVFGLYHGTLIVISMSLEAPLKALYSRLHIDVSAWWFKSLRIVKTFVLVCYGELIFRADSMSAVATLTKNIFIPSSVSIFSDGALFGLGLNKAEFIAAIIGIAVMLAASALNSRLKDDSLRRRIYALPLPARWAVLLLGILTVCVFGVYGPSYDPTPFIYFQF